MTMNRVLAALVPVIFVVSLAVGVDPTFDELTLTMVATRGETATLPCFIDSLGKFKVAWVLHPESIPLTFEDRRVIDDTRFSVIRPSIREWNLQIREVEIHDEGHYLCSINTNPIRNKTVTLSIQEPAAILVEDWRRDVMVIEGDDVTLTCNATGSPPPKISWYKKSDYLIVHGDQLTLRNVTRYDSDIYECVAKNGVGKAATSWTKLTVEFGPRIILPNRRIGQALGRETILECTITASPQAVSYWQKDGRKIMNAVNAAAAAAAAASTSASASRSSTSMAGGHGGVPGLLTSPAVGSATQLQHTKYRIEAYDEGDYTLTLSLRLQVTELSDYGDYVCFASNARGSTHGVVHLYEFSGGDLKPSLMRRDDIGAQFQQPSPVFSSAVPSRSGKQVGEPKKLVSSNGYGRQYHGKAAPITDSLKGFSGGHVTVPKWRPIVACSLMVVLIVSASCSCCLIL